MIDLAVPLVTSVPVFVSGKAFSDKSPKKHNLSVFPSRPSKRKLIPKTSAIRLAQMRAHYQKNKEKVKQRTRQWFLDNPEKAREMFRENERRRRVRKAFGLDSKTLREGFGTRVSPKVLTESLLEGQGT